MGTFRVNRAEHRIVETPFAEHLRRHLRDPSLFTAYNMRTKTWFLAYWINKDHGIAMDVDDLGPNMELADRRMVRRLEESRDGITATDLKKHYIAKHKEHHAREIEECQEAEEVKDWMQKKAGSNMPVLFG